MVSPADILPYAALVLSLLVGLWFYERRNWRLGGVIVLPLLVYYSLQDLMLLVIFIIATAGALLSGMVLRRRTLIYGRRLLYAYLISGIIVGGTASLLIGPSYDGVIITVLPGIFAYNLHREEGIWVPIARVTAGFGILYVAALGAAYLLGPGSLGGFQ